MRLFDMVIKAGGGERTEVPRLVHTDTTTGNEKPAYTLTAGQLAGSPGEIEMDSGGRIRLAVTNGALTIDYGFGTFRLRPASDTQFITEDSGDPVIFELAEDGQVRKVWSEQLCYLEAAAAVKRGDLAAVVMWVGQAVDYFPESARAHYNLARALHGTGKPEEALVHIRKALSINPGYGDAQRLLTSLQLHRFAWIIGLVAVVVVLLLGGVLVRRRKARESLQRKIGS
jgi:tetratricopeptide (TPR) repeat protein